MRTIVLGASNLWFPVVFTSIAVPTASVKIDQLVQENWAMLQFVANKGALAFPRGTGQLGELAKYSDDEIWEAIERRREEISKEAEEEESEEPSNIKEPEWRVFTQAAPDVNSGDFRLRPVDVADAYTDAHYQRHSLPSASFTHWRIKLLLRLAYSTFC